ncbi:MAG: hypothetical protein QFX32_04385 [Methanolinea sp.]|nr:hypothetical protein [Methanolinea sp.]
MTLNKNNPKKNSAVSETVGYVIIFGIMMSGIALVTLFGYPALLSQQQEANIRNMERNMIVLQSDVNALVYKSVPYRETTMQVSGGVLSVEKPSDEKSLSIRVDGADVLELSSSANRFLFGGLVFASDSGLPLVTLQNGAVVKRDISGSVMLSEPRWFFDEATATLVITLIQIDSDKPLAKSGISTIMMEIYPFDITAGSNIINNDYSASPKEVYINYRDVQSDYKNAWENYFQNSMKMEKTVSDWKKDNVKRLVVKAWKVKILDI